MRFVTFLALVVGLGCAQTHRPFVMGPPSSALDGKTFDVTLDDGKTQRPERLSFDMGQFTCAACSDDNFTPAPYSVERSAGATRFKSQAVSPTDGKNNWTGTVRGNSVEGALEWIDKRGRAKRYTFQGKLIPRAAVATTTRHHP